MNRQMGKTDEKEEKEREEAQLYVSLLGVAPQTQDRCAASLL